jgi:hypothetical protein
MKAFRDIRNALAACLAASLLVAPALEAQSASTTGQIRGRVTTAAGPVPGVSVLATNVETGFQRGALTGEDGMYYLRLLPPGSYRVRAEVIGFRTEELPEVRVFAGQTATASFALTEQAVLLEGIEVIGRPPVDVTAASVAQNVTREDLEQLPLLGRDFTDAIALSPLVSPNPEQTTGGQFSMAGARPSQTNLRIDGVDANNSYFGENRGGSRLPFSFSIESVREIQIVTNGFDVEYGSYAGGVVNVITRGGTNEFGGHVYGNYRSDRMVGDEFFTTGDTLRVSAANFEVMQVSGAVSGPILRDRAFFFVSLDGQRRRDPQSPLTLANYAPGGANENPVVHGEMERFIDILANQYGVANAGSLYTPFQTSNDQIALFGRVDWTINDQHRLSLRHNYTDFTNDNEYFAGGFRFGRSAAEVFENRANSFVGELQSLLGERTTNVLRFQLAHENRPRQALTLRPTLDVNLSAGQRVGYGGNTLSYHNYLNETKYEVINNLTHTIGAHTLKFGATALFTHNENQFARLGAGTFSFNNLNDFESFRPSSYTRILMLDGSLPRADLWVTEWGLYGQNEWRATPQLTATFGLRWDQQRFDQDPARVVDVERAFGYPTGTAPIDRNNVSPRLMLAFDPAGDGSRVVRAGAGYFYGRIPYVLGANVAQTYPPVVELNCRGNIDDGDPDAPPSPADYRNWSLQGTDQPFACVGGFTGTIVPEYSFWKPDFEYPETFKGNVGYEQLFARGLRTSVDLVFSRSSKLYTVRNLNLRDPQFALANEGGRLVYQPAEVFQPQATDATVNALRSRRNLDFGNVFVNYNDGIARSFAAVFEAEIPFARLGARSRLAASYAYTNSYDNSSYTCCTAFAGWSSPKVGAFGPNEVGGIGDTDHAWGPTDWTRNHVLVFSALNTELPFGFRLNTFWRIQSGNPWSPEQGGDLNGDGLRFNDRPFIFRPEDLPIQAANEEVREAQRDLYRSHLANHACVGDYVGQIIPRNTCRQPWFNRLDMRLSRSVPTFGRQRAELQLELFNVLNGLNENWGRYVSVRGSNRNLLIPRSFEWDGSNPEEGRILYEVSENFAVARPWDGVVLQFQAQIGLRYSF